MQPLRHRLVLCVAGMSRTANATAAATSSMIAPTRRWLRTWQPLREPCSDRLAFGMLKCGVAFGVGSHHARPSLGDGLDACEVTTARCIHKRSAASAARAVDVDAQSQEVLRDTLRPSISGRVQG